MKFYDWAKRSECNAGEWWLYNISDDVLGVLVAMVTGTSFETFLRERIFDPLGMKDTGFHVPADKIDPLQPLYAPDPHTWELYVWDEAVNGRVHLAVRHRQHSGWGLGMAVHLMRQLLIRFRS